MNQLELATKRALDFSIASLALISLSPVLLFLVLWIRLNSKGPALFRQQRLGKGGRSFECYKFRTMYVDSPDLRNDDGSTFNAEDDPRVTRAGRFLRKTSLDELPQLINVLEGTMSLVGPRPDQTDQIRFYTMRERQRLQVKPGITGLAQISGRNSIPWEQRKQLDLDYVERQSLWLDLRIFLQTIPYVLLRRDVFVQATAEENNEYTGI